MKKELEQKLVERYPTLFKEYGGDMRRTYMAWGCECGDGWFDILDEMCEKLSDPKFRDSVVLAQVKEKFGTLRVYTEVVPEEIFDEVYEITDKAKIKSESTCEVCGKPGILRGQGWLRTLCGECNEKN